MKCPSCGTYKFVRGRASMRCECGGTLVPIPEKRTRPPEVRDRRPDPYTKRWRKT